MPGAKGILPLPMIHGFLQLILAVHLDYCEAIDMILSPVAPCPFIQLFFQNIVDKINSSNIYKTDRKATAFMNK